jgi:hypothetical protein
MYQSTSHRRCQRLWLLMDLFLKQHPSPILRNNQTVETLDQGESEAKIGTLNAQQSIPACSVHSSPSGSAQPPLPM